MLFCKYMQHRIQIFLLAIATFLAGCATISPEKKLPSVPVEDKPHTFWSDTAVEGRPGLAISISRQRAYFFKGDTLVGESPISSGRKGFETPPGTYKVIQKDKDHVSNLYGEYVDEEGNVTQANVDVTKDPAPEGSTFRGAKMSYFLRFTGGYGLHAGILPGHRASHGCVRLPRAMAQHFFEGAEIGMPVVVQD